MSGYIGTQPVPQATQTRQTFTATASQTSFATGGYQAGYLDVFLNGVKLVDGTDYTATNGSDVVLTTGAASGDVLEVVAYTAFEAANVTGATDFTVTGSFTSRGIDDNATSTAMTLDSSGSVLVGTTNSNPTSSAVNVAGQSFSTTGGVRSTVASNAAATFNRKTDDGGIVLFRKDGSTVGSIGTVLTPNREFLIESNTGQLLLGVSGSSNRVEFDGSQLYPSPTSSANLGHPNVRWQDLYLSGGVYLGGTGAANKLDDYEEGTWTPSLARSSSDPTVSYTQRSGIYTKVGNKVFVSCLMNVSSWSGGVGWYQVEGLPFAVQSGGGAAYTQASISDYGNYSLGGSSTAVGGYFSSNATYVALLGKGGGGDSNVNNFSAGSNFYIYLSGTYFTTS